MSVAVITGSGRGIGKAIAIELAKNKYDIVLNSRTKKELQKTEDEIKEIGRKTLVIEGDVTDYDLRKSIIRRTIKKFHRIDVLVNNAGIAWGGDFKDNSGKQIDAMVDINLKALMHLTKDVLPVMLRQKSGIIINISSVAGKIAHGGLAVYCGTKFGVIGFTEAIAEELKGKGIRAYAICPTGTESKMWKKLHPGYEAAHAPEDVAIEIRNLIKNPRKVPTGSAINVRKHV